jgi:hypothetical protein
MWYYSINGQPQGPFDDAALDQLIAAGVLPPEAHVWKEGLPEWLPLAQIRPPSSPEPVLANPALGICTLCRKVVGAENLVDLRGTPVCDSCQPALAPNSRPSPGSPAAWSSGRRVVTYNQRSLPARCYKCNAPVSSPPLSRRLYWHPFAYYLLIYPALLLYVLVALLVRKSASVELYLCPRHARRRLWFLLGAWIGVGLSLAIIIDGIAVNISRIIGAGFLLLALVLVAGLAGASVARATRIKGDAIWMSGASRDFLASLPPWL